MKITEYAINISALPPDADDYSYISEISSKLSVRRVLAVNPRNGDYLKGLGNAQTVIDSYVSDEEWIGVAGAFSNIIYTGYSHHPLLQVSDATYDLVLVCEDMGFVDDCDAVLREYYRVLKPTGVLLGGLWNMSYAESIDRLLSGESVKHDSVLCGKSNIPLNCITARLSELGFKTADIHNLTGNRNDSVNYAEVSKLNHVPVPQHVFNTKIHFICTYK